MTALDDLAYATRAGFMFPSKTLSHADILARVHHAVQAVSLQAITNGFLASLTSRRLELRSALGSYVVGRHVPDHAFVGSDARCALCNTDAVANVDWNMLNFERYKWGGVRHLHLEYVAFDLERFSLLDVPAPTSEDLAVFLRILTIARTMPVTARVGDLEKALGKVVQSNRDERRVLLEILGYCGILATPTHPGFASVFVPPRFRDERSGDWSYPVCWWRGSYGVNATALAQFFAIRS
jgi:hypothetical protein